MYVTGYNGRVRSRAELLTWSQFTGLDPELARRFLGLMDDSHTAGHPVSIGGTIRTVQGQEHLFYSRHHESTPGEKSCCTYNGKRYTLNDGAAHAAPPGRSYHEPCAPPVLPTQCLAIDAIGDMRWLTTNCPRYGLLHFTGSGEPWHIQPVEVPEGRSRFGPRYWPLKTWALPGSPPPSPTKVAAPKPVLTIGANGAEVRTLQTLCNFWGWTDTLGRTLVVDAGYGARTAQAVMAMQRALAVSVTGTYDSATGRALQGFLDAMAATK